MKDYFFDVEGTPLEFDASATSTDIWVCDSAEPGDLQIVVTPPPNPDETTQGQTVTFTGADAAQCSVASPNTSNAAGITGGAGNRVVNTRLFGPMLRLSADRLFDDHDDNASTDPQPQPAGTYLARVFFRGWSGGKATKQFAEARFYVKRGANNEPQFAGTGYAIDMPEGTNSKTDSQSAWLAGDLDEGSRGGTNFNDTLTYKLRGQDRSGSVRLQGRGQRET